jgi:hypothetical protein
MACDFEIRQVGRCPGRALYIGRDETVYIARRYAIYRSSDWGDSWVPDCYVPASIDSAIAMRVPLAARLLRRYIAAFVVLDDGSRLAVARDGIYRAGPGESRMSRVFHITRGSRPLNLMVDGSRVMFGEYGNALSPHEILLYASDDCGKSFHTAYCFSQGDVRHVHNILVDPYEDCYWVFVGDYGEQPGIARLSKDLRTLDWLARGSQKVRAVSAIVEDDCLLYGTDSDIERNSLVRLDKSSGAIDELCETNGSSLYATRFGPLKVISTCVEPNPSTVSNECALYASLDGEDWKRCCVHKKDRYHPVYFQYGTLVLPYGHGSQPRGMFSGQAVEGDDAHVSFIELSQCGQASPCGQAKDVLP